MALSLCLTLLYQTQGHLYFSLCILQCMVWCMVPEFKPRTSHTLGKHSSTYSLPITSTLPSWKLCPADLESGSSFIPFYFWVCSSDPHKCFLTRIPSGCKSGPSTFSCFYASAQPRTKYPFQRDSLWGAVFSPDIFFLRKYNFWKLN